MYPSGLQCGEQDVVRWDSEYGQVEYQANVFASYLLMPLDDFRRQIDPHTEADLEMLGSCARRYNVSLMAVTLKWLEYTGRRTVMVVSRDGFILWARSSMAALRTGAFFRTSGAPIPVPEESLAGDRINNQASIELPPGTWFKAEPCREIAVLSEQYEFTISLLLLSNDAPTSRFGHYREDEEEAHDDLLDRIKQNHDLN